MVVKVLYAQNHCLRRCLHQFHFHFYPKCEVSAMIRWLRCMLPFLWLHSIQIEISAAEERKPTLWLILCAITTKLLFTSLQSTARCANWRLVRFRDTLLSRLGSGNGTMDVFLQTMTKKQCESAEKTNQHTGIHEKKLRESTWWKRKQVRMPHMVCSVHWNQNCIPHGIQSIQSV